jgi:phosphonate transport system substrate-binding protein
LTHLRLSAVLIAMLLVVTACTGGGASPSGAADESDAASAPAESGSGAGGDTADWPDEIVIGFVPSREADTLVENIADLETALAEGLSEAAGREITVEGFVPSDYTGLVTAMESGQAHIGAFGPFSLLQARDRANAEIILQSERNGGATYHTQFFTNNPDKYCEDEPVENDRGDAGTFLNCNGTDRDADERPEGPVAEDAISAIEAGTTVSFVEETSASGYIFPATIFLNNDIDPEEDLERVFAGGHDASVIAVCEGDAEVGVSFDDARAIAESTCDIASEVVVFAYGPEIPNDGWAVLADLPESLKEAITQTLLDYAASEEGAATLDAIYEIDNLVPADEESFQIVEDAAEQLGIEGD